MKRYFLMGCITLLTGCSPLKPEILNHYTLTQYASNRILKSPTEHTLVVSIPEAVAGYQTEQMRYTTKPYLLSSFTKNAWSNPPALMIYPLLIQSLQKSGYFYAVGSGAYVNRAEYRLDTQLLELKQNFTVNPSVLLLKMKAMLVRTQDNHLIKSQIFDYQLPCAQNTPYAGVVAANQATRLLTQRIVTFAIQNIKTANNTAH